MSLRYPAATLDTGTGSIAIGRVDPANAGETARREPRQSASAARSSSTAPSRTGSTPRRFERVRPPLRPNWGTTATKTGP